MCVTLPVRLLRRPGQAVHLHARRGAKYRKRISSPLRDRKAPHIPGGIDIHIEVLRVDYKKLGSYRLGKPSEAIRARVQATRFAENEVRIASNADMRVGEIRQFCQLDEECQGLIRSAMNQLQLSARGYHRVLKLARTIVDLAGSAAIQRTQVAEALHTVPVSFGNIVPKSFCRLLW